MATLTVCRFCKLPMILKDPETIDPAAPGVAAPYKIKAICSNCFAEYTGEIFVSGRPRLTGDQLASRMNEVSK